MMNKVKLIRITVITVLIYLISVWIAWSMLPFTVGYESGYPLWWGFKYNLPFFFFFAVI